MNVLARKSANGRRIEDLHYENLLRQSDLKKIHWMLSNSISSNDDIKFDLLINWLNK